MLCTDNMACDHIALDERHSTHSQFVALHAWFRSRREGLCVRSKREKRVSERLQETMQLAMELANESVVPGTEEATYWRVGGSDPIKVSDDDRGIVMRNSTVITDSENGTIR